MLQANPLLTWRSVRNILIQTANPIRTDDPDLTATYTENGAGYFHSYGVGFGMVNAKAAVNYALGVVDFGSDLNFSGKDSLVIMETNTCHTYSYTCIFCGTKSCV